MLTSYTHVKQVIRNRRKIRVARARTTTTLRDVIRNTARELFARAGYESVSLRRIGTEVGCSPMAMYRHYASKEDLLVSICEETFEQMIQTIDREAGRPGTPLERLRACVSTVIDFHLGHPNHFKVTFMTEIPPGPAAQRKVAMGQRVLDRLRAGVRECAEARGLDIDIERATQMLRIGMRICIAPDHNPQSVPHGRHRTAQARAYCHPDQAIRITFLFCIAAYIVHIYLHYEFTP